MKFEYDKDKLDDREVLAYLDHDGDLVMPEYGSSGAIVLVSGGKAEGGHDWDLSEASHKFYKGDKVTITF